MVTHMNLANHSHRNHMMKEISGLRSLIPISHKKAFSSIMDLITWGRIVKVFPHFKQHVDSFERYLEIKENTEPEPTSEKWAYEDLEVGEAYFQHQMIGSYRRRKHIKRKVTLEEAREYFECRDGVFDHFLDLHQFLLRIISPRNLKKRHLHLEFLRSGLEMNPGPRGKKINNVRTRRRRRAPASRRNGNLEKLSRGLERPFPDRRMIKVITTTDGSAQNSAAGYAVIECRLADPTNTGFANGVGTGTFTIATAGIADMAAYSLARVRSATVEVSGTSNDTSAVIACNLIFSDTQPSTVITTFALAKAAQINYFHTPIRKIAIAAGNSAFRFAPCTVSARQVIGDVMPITDRDFVTVVNPSHSAPVQEWWCALVVTSIASGTNLTNGLEVSLTVTQLVEAFSRLVGA